MLLSMSGSLINWALQDKKVSDGHEIVCTNMFDVNKCNLSEYLPEKFWLIKTDLVR